MIILEIIRLSKAKRKLNIDGSTINRENYENIDLEENELAINLDINKLYALGIDVQSQKSNLYIFVTLIYCVVQ